MKAELLSFWFDKLLETMSVLDGVSSSNLSWVSSTDYHRKETEENGYVTVADLSDEYHLSQMFLM